MDMSQYLGIFLDEAREHLQAMNEGLLALEHNPSDTTILERIFRAAHTLKGMSATMGFTDVAELTHSMENILDKLRHGQMTVAPESMDVLFRCLDVLEAFTNAVASGQDATIDVNSLVADLQALSSGTYKATATAAPPVAPVSAEASTVPATTSTSAAGGGEVGLDELLTGQLVATSAETDTINEGRQQGLCPYQVDVELDEQCILKSARAYLVIRNLEEMGRVLRTEPSIEHLEEENFDRVFSVFFVGSQQPEEIANAVQSISEISTVRVRAYDDGDSQSQHDAAPTIAETEVTEARSQAAASVATAPVAPSAGSAPVGSTVTASPLGSAAGVAKPEGAPVNAGKSQVRQTVRVDIEKLDSLMNLVGELVINRSRLAQIGLATKVPVLNDTVEDLARITTDLQTLVMKARMVPIDQVFNRFPRMIRDLARELGKEINLEIEGNETELDRTVVDEIGDPLVHLLRNAVDHGIESPEARTAAGKSPVGTVKLSARHEGNQVVVELSDDGKGLDVTKIKAKAVKQGFITEDEAAALSDQEAFQLIFRSGLSTAEKITDISGRGVGLDVVNAKIQSLNGTVELVSKVGSGTRFMIKLPLTLAIIQALLVQLGSKEVYALPLENIEEIIKVTREQLKTIQRAEYLLFRGQVIPILRLAELFETPDTDIDKEENNVVVVKCGGRRVGIIVDYLLGQQEIVIKSLDALLADIKGFAGATILGDGKVALILDVLNLHRLEAAGQGTGRSA